MTTMTNPPTNTPWYVHAILVQPAKIRANLERVCATFDLPRPNDWQLCLGVLRLWHRLAFRTDTVGTSRAGAVRRTWRARAMAWRALRLPCLLVEGAVVPLDFTGLRSSPERLIRHLLGAHHDHNQFVYDFEVLAGHGALEHARRAAREVVECDDARSRWLRDLSRVRRLSRVAARGARSRDRARSRDHDVRRGVARSRHLAAGLPVVVRRAAGDSLGHARRMARRLVPVRLSTLRAPSRIARDTRSRARTRARTRSDPMTTTSADPSSHPAPWTPARARRLSRTALADVFASGRAFDPSLVAGWVYRGTSLGLPNWLERLTWIKFAKAFERDGDRIRGWNIRIEQDDLDRPWRPKRRRGRPITFGPFVVVEREGVVLDYGLGKGAMRALRDPVVALDPRADVLLGRSLLAFGPATLPTPSYFLLERDAHLDELA